MSLRAGLAAVLVWSALAGGPAAGAPAGDPPGDSVYQLTGEFRDQAGRPTRLHVHRGHPVLMSMVYASCSDACPLLIAELRRVEASLPPARRADVRVVLVSLDPEHDTPAALGHLAERHGLDPARWRLLTGADDAVREVAAVLGVKFRRLANGAINHSSVIAVLDGRGVIRSRIEGVTAGDPELPGRVAAALARATAGPGR